MPRHYTDDEKRLVLDRLIANHGDVSRTAAEFHLDASTLYRWQKQLDSQNSGQSQLQYSQHLQHFANSDDHTSAAFSPRPEGEGSGVRVGEGLPPETTKAFQTLHDKLLTLANTLSHRIEEAIDEAPLNQRVAALAQLIDRITKLASLLPQPEDEVEQEVQYIYEYEVEHHVEKKKESPEENSYCSHTQTDG